METHSIATDSYCKFEINVRLIRYTGDSIQEDQTRLSRVRNDLTCLGRLLVLFLRLQTDLSSPELALLEAHLCPAGPESDEQGWEEQVDASLTFLLKTVLAKTARESVPLPASALDRAALDHPAALHRHLTLVVDRLAKGARLILPPTSPQPVQGLEPSSRK